MVHRAVARATAELYPDKLEERAALLADHWEAAGDALEAARWHRRAAEWVRATDLSAALDHWRRVRSLLERVPESEETIELGLAAPMRILGLAWTLGISPEEGADLCVEGEALARRSGDLRSVAIFLTMHHDIRSATGGAFTEEGSRSAWKPRGGRTPRGRIRRSGNEARASRLADRRALRSGAPARSAHLRRATDVALAQSSAGGGQVAHRPNRLCGPVCLTRLFSCRAPATRGGLVCHCRASRGLRRTEEQGWCHHEILAPGGFPPRRRLGRSFDGHRLARRECIRRRARHRRRPVGPDVLGIGVAATTASARNVRT